jgi:hypothetical protein
MRAAFVGVLGAEICQESRTKPLGLADVEHPAERIRHAMIAGRLSPRARADEQVRSVEERGDPLGSARTAHDWQRWQKTVMRSIACVL